MAAIPVANEKSQVNIVKQQWFTDAVGQMENLHFSTPHVQICLTIYLTVITGSYP